MRVRLLLGALTLGVLGVGTFPASAGPVPPACVVVDQTPVHAQVGYAPTGPAGCTTVP